MEWSRSDTLALAAANCILCEGLGLPSADAVVYVPCSCVARRIFRICYDKFRAVRSKEKSLTHVSLDAYGEGITRGYVWGRKDEEFLADFFLVSRRALNEFEWTIFTYRRLLGADARLCARRLGMERGVFNRHLYRVEEKLGLAYRETEPYALFPLSEYFAGTTKKHCHRGRRYRLREEQPARPTPVRPPLAA